MFSYICNINKKTMNMVELKEKASSYAVENVLEILKEAFAKVYADGYRDGYKDREDEIPVDIRGNKTEYVDLGLPSGTLWSTDYERDGESILFQPHIDTESLSIPTREQWEELVDICKWEYDKPGSFHEAYCIGPNGNILKFCLTGMIHVNKKKAEGKTYFWISEEKEGNEKSAVCIYDASQNEYHYTDKCVNSIFSGYKLPVRLVKSK